MSIGIHSQLPVTIDSGVVLFNGRRVGAVVRTETSYNAHANTREIKLTLVVNESELLMAEAGVGESVKMVVNKYKSNEG